MRFNSGVGGRFRQGPFSVRLLYFILIGVCSTSIMTSIWMWDKRNVHFTNKLLGKASQTQLSELESQVHNLESQLARAQEVANRETDHFATCARKMKDKEKTIDKLYDILRAERKASARLEEKVQGLLVKTVRMHMQLLNFTGETLPDAGDLLQAQMESEAAMKAAIAAEDKKKRKKAKVLKLMKSKMGDETTDPTSDAVSNTMLRRLKSAIHEIEGNGTKVDAGVFDVVMDEIFDDLDYEFIMNASNSSLDSDITPKEVSEAQEEQISAHAAETNRQWISLLRNHSTDLLEGFNHSLGEDVKRVMFRQMPWQNIMTSSASRMVQIIMGRSARHERCALVGNSQRLMLAERGDQIDDYPVVMRLNQAPTEGFERWVGSKTTYRMINNFWSVNYATSWKKVQLAEAAAPPGLPPVLKRSPLSLEPNVTLIVSRTDAQKYHRLVKTLEKGRPDVALLQLAREGVDGIGAYLRALKLRLENLRALEYPGKGSPSSGIVGLFVLLQLCDQVDVFGVGQIGETTSWHYWEERNFASSREFGLDPHHSFDLERETLQVLDQAGVINIKSIPPENEKNAAQLKDYFPKKLQEVQKIRKNNFRQAMEQRAQLEKQMEDRMQDVKNLKEFEAISATEKQNAFVLDADRDEDGIADEEDATVDEDDNGGEIDDENSGNEDENY